MDTRLLAVLSKGLMHSTRRSTDYYAKPAAFSKAIRLSIAQATLVNASQTSHEITRKRSHPPGRRLRNADRAVQRYRGSNQRSPASSTLPSSPGRRPPRSNTPPSVQTNLSIRIPHAGTLGTPSSASTSIPPDVHTPSAQKARPYQYTVFPAPPLHGPTIRPIPSSPPFS
ncbi:uncharacterized protein EI97DRAFT_439226 [Westerdykella ornata]|uniref:Uncharacterized protein n=1 Tax=Westerdykella ornata TaxID=318751 RepID=A0A6A6JVB6_WESOR|nr:uncharacterized protein EI97DRAFT_439226 [Westerdykella ornata]KAF2280164.1 hypothetical protein EI97DRAFT_439226 [Westerdykella ornata]